MTKAWAREAKQALARADRGERRIDHRSLAERRDEAYQAGDLERAADLSVDKRIEQDPRRTL